MTGENFDLRPHHDTIIYDLHTRAQKMKFLEYSRGEVVDKAPASGATFFRKLIKGSNRKKADKQNEKTCFHEADPVKTESPDGVNPLRKLFSRRNDMCREDSDSTLLIYTSFFDDDEEEEEEEEEEEDNNCQVQLSQLCRSEFTLNDKVPTPAMRARDQPTPIVKKTSTPRPTPIVKDTRIPLELKLVALASCHGEKVDKAPITSTSMCQKWQDADSGSKPYKTNKKISFRLDEPTFNFQTPLSFYQLILVEGNLVSKRVYPEPLAFYQLVLVDGNLVPKRVTQSPSHLSTS
jgi:hypothetical protein